MSLPITSIVQNSDRSWTFAWSAVGSAGYRIVLWGQQIDTAPSNSYTYTRTDYQLYPPPLEVVAAGQALSEQYQPFLQIQWYDEACAYFDVQASSDGITYATTQHVPEGALWVYSYQTPTQPDGTVVYLRVGAIDSLGNESGFESYRSLIVTPPTPPDGQVVISYVQVGHQIQVAAV